MCSAKPSFPKSSPRKTTGWSRAGASAEGLWRVVTEKSGLLTFLDRTLESNDSCLWKSPTRRIPPMPGIPTKTCSPSSREERSALAGAMAERSPAPGRLAPPKLGRNPDGSRAFQTSTPPESIPRPALSGQVLPACSSAHRRAPIPTQVGRRNPTAQINQRQPPWRRPSLRAENRLRRGSPARIGEPPMARAQLSAERSIFPEELVRVVGSTWMISVAGKRAFTLSQSETYGVRKPARSLPRHTRKTRQVGTRRNRRPSDDSRPSRPVRGPPRVSDHRKKIVRFLNKHFNRRAIAFAVVESTRSRPPRIRVRVRFLPADAAVESARSPLAPPARGGAAFPGLPPGGLAHNPFPRKRLSPLPQEQSPKLFETQGGKGVFGAFDHAPSEAPLGGL